MKIQGLFIEINSKEEFLLSRLRTDFEFFIIEKYSHGPLLKIETELVDNIPKDIIPKNLKPIFQRNNSITYEENGVRYNDYYGSVVSIFEAKKNSALILGKECEKLYEILYLFILSRSGKFGDLKGSHRIHAFAFVKNFTGLICMQPTRGGKSTLLTELLLNQNIEIISDDTPLLNTKGELLPFPLRVSLESIPSELLLQQGDSYLLKREFYKAKHSISMKAFNRPIAQKCNYYHFVEAHRSTYAYPYVKRMSSMRLFKSLFKHMVIGVGLPIIFEYFWESGSQDFIRKSVIFLRRLTLALRLSITHKGFELYLTTDTKKNAEALLELI